MNATTMRILAAAALSLGLGMGAVRAATIAIADGAIYTLAEADNIDANRLDVGGSATLKLTGTATDGVFTLNTPILFTAAGTLSLDVSSLAGCTVVRMVSQIRDGNGGENGVVAFPAEVVRAVFGTAERGADSALGLPVFEAEVTFDNPSGALVFTNDLSFVHAPACSWSVADNARPALFGAELLGAGDFALTGYDVQIAAKKAFASGATISVPVGRTLFIRPVSLNNKATSTWGGASAAIENNVVLGGAGANVVFLNNNTIEGLVGTISGAGDVSFKGNGGASLTGALDFQGAVTANHSGTFTLAPTNGATLTPTFTAAASGVVLKVAPSGTGAKAVRLAKYESTASAANEINVAANTTLTIGTLSASTGPVLVSSSGAGASLTVETLAANATLRLRPGVSLALNSAGAGAKVVLESAGEEGEEWSVSGPSAGDAISPSFTLPATAASGTLALGGKISIPAGQPLPFGTVRILAGAEVSASIADGTKIVNAGGALTQLVTTWRDKVTLWTDASAANTFSYVKDEFPLTTFLADNQIMEWKDCRASHQVDGAFRIRLTPFDSAAIQDKNTHKQTFPFVEENDGLQSVRLAYQYGRGFVATGPGAAATVSTKFALLVFNSKNGGGNALLGTTGNKLRREAATVPTPSAAMVDDSLIYANVAGLSFRTNGVEVADPAGTKPTGGWQIIAISCAAGLNVGSICHDGTDNMGSGNGGQIYAEIMLFGEMPTEREIEAAETYLARKWNLPLGHEPVEEAVPVGLSGSGSWSLATDASVTNGVFSGTVNLNGHRLSIATGSDLLPFAEKDIPSDGRVLWIDPSLAGAVVHGADAEKPLEVMYIYARDNSGLLTHATNMCVASPYQADVDLRVRTVFGSRAAGAASTWLDFSNGYANDEYRNHLEVKKDLSSAIPTSYTNTSTFVSIDVKAGFFALDTTRGGGTVIASTVNGNGGSFRWSSGTPIWQSGCAAAVKEADAYLDGKQIVATEVGYSGRPEVFSFNMQESAAAQDAKVFGYSGTKTSSTVNPEIMGEWLLFSKTLDDADRRGIEAYLMKKWLGRQLDGYSDFRDMTVAGDGVLAVDDVKHLPALSAAFTGTVELAGNTLSFTLPANGGQAALDAVDLSASRVALPDVVTVDVNMVGAQPGTYSLLRVGQFVGEPAFSLGTIAGQKKRRVELVVSETEVAVCVCPMGMQFIVR